TSVGERVGEILRQMAYKGCRQIVCKQTPTKLTLGARYRYTADVQQMLRARSNGPPRRRGPCWKRSTERSSTFRTECEARAEYFWDRRWSCPIPCRSRRFRPSCWPAQTAAYLSY